MFCDGDVCENSLLGALMDEACEGQFEGNKRRCSKTDGRWTCMDIASPIKYGNASNLSG